MFHWKTSSYWDSPIYRNPLISPWYPRWADLGAQNSAFILGRLWLIKYAKLGRHARDVMPTQLDLEVGYSVLALWLCNTT